jgi:hypothetical protein
MRGERREMSPEEAERRAARAAAYQKDVDLHIAGGYARKRGEDKTTDTGFHRVSASSEAHPSVARVEMENNQRSIESRIVNALGTSNPLDPKDKGFSRDRPIKLSLVVGFGDPDDEELPTVMDAASNMQRAVKHDGRRTVIELMPIEVYCFFREEFPDASGRSPTRSVRLTCYIIYLDDNNTLQRTVLETDDARALVRRLHELSAMSINGRTVPGLWRILSITNIAALSSQPQFEFESEAEAQAARGAARSGASYLSQVISQTRASGTTKPVVQLD